MTGIGSDSVRMTIGGRQAVAELYRPYGTTFFLDRCYDLAVHHDPTTGVVVLEYASQGRVVPTRNSLRQPVHLSAHDRGSQGHALA